MIDFDVTMVTNFDRSFFSENRKSLFKMKTNHFLLLKLMFLAHISIPLLVVITFGSMSAQFSEHPEIQDGRSMMATT